MPDARDAIADVRGAQIRQAVDSLRGYRYQVVASAAAWVALTEDEALHLEVAEDYAVATRGALTGVQIKDNAAPITSRSGEVVQTIDSLFALRAANPRRKISIRHLTTAEIGLEREKADRVEGRKTLEYWADAADGQAPIAPLRLRLSRLPLGKDVLAFLADADDDRVRRDLLQPITWVCGTSNLAETQRLLDDTLAVYGEMKGVSRQESRRVSATIIDHVFETIVQNDPGKRVLKKVDFQKVFEAATLVTLPRAVLNTVTSGTSTSIDPGVTVFEELEPNYGTLASRADLLEKAEEQLTGGGITWLHATSGSGKTTLATDLAE